LYPELRILRSAKRTFTRHSELVSESNYKDAETSSA